MTEQLKNILLEILTHFKTGLDDIEAGSEERQPMQDEIDFALPLVEKLSIHSTIDRISRMKDDSGRQGCTYGDTEFDSLSVVYGYNRAIDDVIETIKKIE
ncbi:hypothetical protein Phi4:1_gp189 [Cellulophaga phage phi4:1]|uniref:Uncharacterized protein n=5 Tax=Lightbulbvirus TaxID=1918522 RepID=A0A0S2MWW2_9CAUD|nr:hypothetical protein Phi4:1_gp189 [Cellulophaga phage phi4:1]YP_008241685.1 hypothetical protein Phi17:2_gp190 [Cellulophaga phage phi17:2]ALO80198.1 hypothetical protein Phi4113_189 [Cellulophaga phage phi4:1_13]ALO80395.1 hypothetical protein Phi4118_189 [Cellulophaga phage phi4:1_18]ALO80593.1 hypothetical protein Phi17218_190 [Cellulophaga phage phi17:2_18]AGO47723.1 hypothetical protein Phi17:2_gp190 [Cellulophaga phage phi17:2]AGO49602.1 hypothetical protein Phi4:1_gp189 [Cellulophag